MYTTPPTDPAEPQRQADTAARARHWRDTQRLTGALLLVWFAVGYGITWFARDLDFAFFGWPFSFWVAAQGGTIVFVVLLVVFARRMRRLDRALERAGALPPGAASAPPAAPTSRDARALPRSDR